jgi:hypothetical protein
MDSATTFFRFRERHDWQGKPKGYARSYDVLDGDTLRWQCDVTHDLWPAVEFVSRSTGVAEFALKPTRRIAALSYEVLGGTDLQCLARVSRGLGVRWKIEDASGTEIARLANPASWPKLILQQAFDASVMEFVFVAKDQMIGVVHRIARPKEPEPRNVIQRWIRRHLSMFDWALELREPAASVVHLPVLIASTVLLLELDVKAQAA